MPRDMCKSSNGLQRIFGFPRLNISFANYHRVLIIHPVVNTMIHPDDHRTHLFPPDCSVLASPGCPIPVLTSPLVAPGMSRAAVPPLVLLRFGLSAWPGMASSPLGLGVKVLLLGAVPGGAVLAENSGAWSAGEAWTPGLCWEGLLVERGEGRGGNARRWW